ncbi:hypothetical protein PsYK624_157070 [Phanerochaete sordida]|uniref:F-box domain-containing protein n=1 Tax=Phanerochaete sordida TaxID=48140 RepID=A0A9P3LM82_9APHY|nr:hypothetical protein PsYK624_157070 [Phanerochaete sordida]
MTALLPNIRQLVVEYDFLSSDNHTSSPEPEPSNALYLYLFLSPKLQNATLETWGKDSMPLLHQLAISCPQLRYLGMNSFPETVGFVRCFSSLEGLSCSENPIDASVLDQMAYLPSLRELCVALPDDFSRIERRGPHDQLPFAALKTLDLCGPSEPQHIIKFLRSVDLKQLHNLSLFLSQCQADEALKTLNAVSKFTTLRSLDISAFHTKVYSYFPPQAILRLSHLEKLEFSLGGMSTTNHSAEELGRACPKLRHLKMQYGSDQFWTLDVLESFATHLPALEHLIITLDTTVAPVLGEPKARSQVPISLDLESSQLSKEHWEPTAAYIARVYPNATFTSNSLWRNWADEKLVDVDENMLNWRYVGRAVKKARSGSP